MHLLDSVRTRFTCVPVVHEVSAGIASEYFTEVSPASKAFALVTAGPGLTNILTSIAQAWTESRELLVIGGQVKSTDLAQGSVRQRGIQEIDGVAVAAPVTKKSVRLTDPIPMSEVADYIQESWIGRPGPVVIEMCLDVQGAPARPDLNDWPKEVNGSSTTDTQRQPTATRQNLSDAVSLLERSSRPLVLIGGGVQLSDAQFLVGQLEGIGIPVATTYNGSDRVDSRSPIYFGRPNTWGMRWANILLQQADLILAAGTRLGLQQTGFNWQEFASVGEVIQVDIDKAELDKGHPRIAIGIQADASATLHQIVDSVKASAQLPDCKARWREWVNYGMSVRDALPLSESANKQSAEFINTYDFVEALSELTSDTEVIVPCSSGGAFTVFYQVFLPKFGQRIVSNKSLASMGVGLAGAIGAAFAQPSDRVIHIEGDGGFAQNLQELGTIAANGLNVKSFIFMNNGYASIRMTQRNYFNGAWIGCDTDSGVGLPNMESIIHAYGLPCRWLNAAQPLNEQIAGALIEEGPYFFLVPVDPEQTYFPKISSRVRDDGLMDSNPLHLMSPDLDDKTRQRVMRFIQETK